MAGKRRVRWGTRITPVEVYIDDNGDEHEMLDSYLSVNRGGVGELDLLATNIFIGEVSVSDTSDTQVYADSSTIIFLYLRNKGTTNINIKHTSLGSNYFTKLAPKEAFVMRLPAAVPASGLYARSSGDYGTLEYYLGREA